MYQIRTTDIEIPVGDPFRNCKLGRQKYAEVLKTLTIGNNNGCVISLNGAWGTGKTTFIQMFKQMMNNEGYPTLYFNAWETDYISDPIIGLLGEMKKLEGKGTSSNLKDMVQKIGPMLLKRAMPELIKHILKKHLGEPCADTLTEVAKGGAELFEAEIENYENQKKSIEGFKKVLGEYVSTLGEKAPLIFIVDELDRCNPHYAVMVLERIKHLFSIPQIVFVLAIDKEQLCNSIKGYYGSDRIDAAEYLRRFIDIEYTLPNPDYRCFIKVELERLDFQALFKVSQKMNSWEETITSILVSFAEKSHLSLRQVQKMMNQVRLSFSTLDVNNENYTNHVIALFLLVYIRSFHSEVYDLIKKKGATLQEVASQIERCLPLSLFNKEAASNRSPNSLEKAFTAILLMYSSDENGYPKYSLLENNEEGLKIKFSVERFHEADIAKALENYHNMPIYITLDSLISKVELYDNVRVN